ncbi:hypothetical protein KIL84_006550 [Mauremys mutica]|uniref:Uncharacterized protein n=1 Tax=Mauremys mutica TaxID=74926 RepID=A0A9D3WZJ2_9SAUR|nr:hypothetical protein KIL84_006550 [Mauremys mutica]
MGQLELLRERVVCGKGCLSGVGVVALCNCVSGNSSANSLTCYEWGSQRRGLLSLASVALKLFYFLLDCKGNTSWVHAEVSSYVREHPAGAWSLFSGNDS